MQGPIYDPWRNDLAAPPFVRGSASKKKEVEWLARGWIRSDVQCLHLAFQIVYTRRGPESSICARAHTHTHARTHTHTRARTHTHMHGTISLSLAME